MKILTVVFGLGIGGTERAAQNFALAYSQLGHDSRVFCTGHDGTRGKELRENGINVYFSNKAGLNSLKGWNPELMHIHSHPLNQSDFDLIKEISSNAIIVETNVFSEPSPWEEHLHKSFQLSTWCMSLYILRGGRSKISCVLPYPIEITRFKRAHLKTREDFRRDRNFSLEDTVLGRVGQPIDAKWSRHVIETFEKICKEFDNVKLLLVGPPNSIIKLADKSAFRDKIHCEDPIAGDENLSVVYSSIDIFLHVSDIGESFGMVLAESLLCETPIITLATPWADNSQAEVIGDGLGGFVANSPRDLYTYCKKLVLDKQLRADMGKKGSKHVATAYNSLDVAKNAIKLAVNSNPELHRPRESWALSRIYKGSSLFTKILLKSISLRKYTIFSTGYISVGDALARKFNTFKFQIYRRLELG